MIEKQFGDNIDGEENDMDMKDDDTINANLPIRQYLDAHIMPQLIEALEQLTKDRPDDPIQYIGEYMLKEASKGTELKSE